jgi:hypothetical protein
MIVEDLLPAVDRFD